MLSRSAIKDSFNSQFGKFIFIGMLSTIINYGIFYTMLRLGNINYIISSVLGYLSGVFFGFYFNKNWSFTFRSKSPLVFIKYMSAYLFSLLVSVILLKVLVDYYMLDARISNALVIGVTTVLNYLAVKFIVFR